MRPAGALDPVDSRAGETGLSELVRHAVWGMEIGSGEELRPAAGIGVAELPVDQVLGHDRPEVRIAQPAVNEPAPQPRAPADRHGEEPAARAPTPPGLRH